MRTKGLNQSASVVLDGSGNGIASLGPGTPGHVWQPQTVSIFMTGAIPTPGGSNVSVVYLYAGNDTSAISLIDSTYNVNANSTGAIQGIVLYPGQFISAQWVFGNPHATATVNVVGTRIVP